MQDRDADELNGKCVVLLKFLSVEISKADKNVLSIDSL
jgi:hypothetical protein